MKRLLLLSSVIFCMLSCSPTENESSEKVELTGAWKLTQIGESVVPADLMMTLNIDSVMNVNGKSACNSFFGKVDYKNDSLFFGKLGSTRMMCDELKNEWETKYLSSLTSPLKIDVSGNGKFTLSNEKSTLSFEKNTVTSK